MAENSSVAERFGSISRLIADARYWAENDERLGAHLGSYICVLLLGAVEYSVEELVSERVSSIEDRETANYVVKVIGERFRNPDWGSINRLLGEFDERYRARWTQLFPANGEVGQALLSIVAIKNQLAHQGTIALQVTLSDVQSYFERVSRAVDALEQIIRPAVPSE